MEPVPLRVSTALQSAVLALVSICSPKAYGTFFSCAIEHDEVPAF